MKRFLQLFFSCSLVITSSHAQVNTSGKEYYVALGNGFWSPVILSVASKHTATVDLHFTSDPDLDQTVVIPANTVEFIELTPDEVTQISNTSSGVIGNKSLHVLSDSNIVLHLVSNSPANQDAMLIHPLYCQPAEDSVVFYPIGVDVSFATTNGFCVAGQCDGTIIEITPEESLGSYSAGIPFYITLDAGETFWIDNAAGNDQTGTKIKVVESACINPINVYTTNEANFITYPAGGDLSGYCCADVTLEENQQVVWWDTLYHFVPFYRVPDLSMIRLISASDNNEIYFDGTLVKTLTTGEPWDTVLTAPTIIQAKDVIGMSQFMLSHSSDEIFSIYVPGDPAHLWLTPLKYGIRESLFQPFPTGYLSATDTTISILTIVAKATDTEAFLNSTDLSSGYIPFPGDPEYVYQQVLLDGGTVYHFSSAKPVIAYMTRLNHCGSLLYALGDTRVTPAIVRDTLSGNIDTMYLCASEGTVILDAGDADEYHWPDGTTSRTREVSETGQYLVYTSFWEEGCYKDMIENTFVVLDAWYRPELGNDTIICDSGPLILRPGVNADSYLWQDGSDKPEFSAYKSGQYWVVTSQNHCISSDTINVTFVNLVAYLGEDIPVCQGEEVNITLSASLIPGAAAYWSTGAGGETIHVTDTGIYSVNISYPPCSVTDSILVFSEMCRCNVLTPTVFSPNNDGINDVFQPRTEDGCPVTEYALSVFNRWGQRVFHSSDINKGWDGTFQGAACDLGTYFYHVKMKVGTLLIEKEEKGDITLLR